MIFHVFSALLLGNRMRPLQPEITADNASSESTSAESGEDYSRDVNPFESLFPNIFPRFPLDDEHTKEKNSTDDKTPVNYENKEKKVVDLGGRKFVKTTQIKKVKNDFGQFHSVISSYQPFDEKIHDENGNEKIKPEDSDKTLDKKDVDSSTPSTDEKVDSSDKIDTSSDDKVDVSSSTTSTTAAPIEKEESTESSDKSVTPDADDEDNQPEKLKAENLSKENEIPDKNTEIKVDQVN